MRSEAFSFVALSIVFACSNATEPAQTDDGVGGTGGAGDSSLSHSSQAPASGGNPGKNTASGGQNSTLTSATSRAQSNSGGSDALPNDSDAIGGAKNASDVGGARSVAGSSNADSSGAGGVKNTGGLKSAGGTKNSGVKSTGGAKNSASTKGAGGSKNTENAVGGKSTTTTRALGGSGGGGSPNTSGGSNTDTASTTVGCDRAGLEAAVKTYLAALESKDTTKMPLSSSVKYTEVASIKSSTSALGQGLWQAEQPVAFSRSLLDVTGCETFTELFVTETSHPYAIGTRLAVKNGEIAEIYSIVTDSDDWNFDATAYAKCAESEDWGVLPEASRSTREELIAAGQAYFDIFSDKSTEVPWGNPCYRLEGGKGCTPAMDKASTTCNVGIPDGITFTKTHWVVDEDIGAVVGITMFGGANPDTHLFRLVSGKIRYVHTLTVMK